MTWTDAKLDRFLGNGKRVKIRRKVVNCHHPTSQGVSAPARYLKARRKGTEMIVETSQRGTLNLTPPERGLKITFFTS